MFGRGLAEVRMVTWHCWPPPVSLMHSEWQFHCKELHSLSEKLDQNKSLTYSASASGCHGGAGAAVAAVGAPVESLLAELAVLPLGVVLAVQAGAWGRDRSTKTHLAAGTGAEHLEQESAWSTLNYQSSQVILDALRPKHDPGLL